MSVHLSLTKTAGGYVVDIPISTQAFFMKAWFPLAQKKSLLYVQAMLSAPDVDQEYLTNLTRELKLLKNYVPEFTDLSPIERKALVDRIDYILEEIEPEISYPQIKGWIG